MKEKKVAILQSNYIPWKGYFDMINMVDEFILYDDAQYTHHDWRNRNLIKTKDELSWLTIPVNISGHFMQKINEVIVSNSIWSKKHWKTIVQNYSRAKYFIEYKEEFENLYLNINEKFLYIINRLFIEKINKILNIQTKLSNSSDFNIYGDKSEKVLSLCKQAGASIYLSGPAAKQYLNESIFNEEGIKIEWMNYDGYPEYEQFYPPFEHGVTILDLLFHTGEDAKKYMKSFNKI